MEVTRETFEAFLTRLKFHCEGAGVDDHATSHPLFIVQHKAQICGIDLDYAEHHFWRSEGGEGEYSDEEVEEELAEMRSEDPALVIENYDLRYDNEIRSDNEVLFEKIGYLDNWEFVSAHFTREAAEAFIARKKHDYRELRVYVSSQYYCDEFNTIIKGLLTGKIGFLG